MTGRICYLHVGTGKTGSSALQYALTLAHDALRIQGYLYPDDARNFQAVLAGKPTAGNAIRINKLLRNEDPDAAARIVAAYRNRPHHVIWSCEGLANRRGDVLKEFGAALRSLGYTTRCLVFFRPQADMIVSSYLQQVKSGRVDVGLETYVSRKFGDRLGQRWNWLGRVEKLRDAFDDLKVVWYPNARRKGPSGVVDAAFEWLGLEPPADQPPRIVNPTPGREALHVLRKYGNGRKYFADAFLAEAERLNLLGSPVRLSPETAAHIHEVSREANAVLLREFCPELIVEDEILPPIVEDKLPLDGDVVRELTAIAESIGEAGDTLTNDGSTPRSRPRLTNLRPWGLSRLSSRGVRP